MQTSSQTEAGARAILRKLRTEGYTAYFAGGCVRDQLMGRPPKDYDVVTDARPEDILACFPKARAIGKAFGVIGVIHEGALYEVATFRAETGYTDGRRPDHVTFTDAEHDAQRRDFTINALFYDPLNDQIHDFVGGLDDLSAKRLRTVGPASERFAEDHLRMLRAIRFANTFGFEMDHDLLDAISRHADRIQRISAERIRDELTRTFVESQYPGTALRQLLQTGLLAYVLPEVAATDGVEQPPQFHPEGDVFTHTCLMLDLVEPDERAPEIMWAVLLHDIGKPPTYAIGKGTDGEDRIRFDGHDAVGAKMAEVALRRLRFSNVFIERVTHCVRNHMRFAHVQEMRRAKVRALIGSPTFPTELLLHRVDCASSHRDLSNFDYLVEQRRQFESEPVLPPRLLTGRDLIDLGMDPGPEIGRLLKAAYQQQLEDPEMDRDKLLAWIRDMMRNG